jgi:Flp pilus assembly protein TadB
MLTEPVGRVLLVVAAAGMVIGHLWIRHLVRPRY